MKALSYLAVVGKKGAYVDDYAVSARAALRRFVDEAGAAQNEIALRLGTSQATISKVLDGTQQMQMPLAVALSKAMGVTVDDVMRRSGQPAEPTSDRYPNRARAVIAARALGKSEQAISDVQAMALRADTDPSPDWWFDQIVAVDKRLADPFLSSGPPGKRVTPGGDF